MNWPRSILAGCIYFALVFTLGFALGAVRVLIVIPAIGERLAVLLELPLMIAGCVVGALIAARLAGLARRGPWPERAMMGLVGVAMLLVLELTLVRWLRGLTLREALLGGDWVATAAYRSSLIIMGVIPVLLALARSGPPLGRGAR